MKKSLFLYCILSTFPLLSVTKLPQVIDLNQLNRRFEDPLNHLAWDLGYSGLNYASEMTCFFALLKSDYPIDTVIETGTCLGATARLFSLLFDQVHTIEVFEPNYQQARALLSNTPNVQCYLGNSEQVLETILPSLKDKPILFYLDAHWHSHWPLLNELEEISKTHRDNCIVVIDDFKVPRRGDIPYDRQGIHECSYEYIQAHLSKIFTEYSMHFLIPKSAASRAKFIAIPKKWQKE